MKKILIIGLIAFSCSKRYEYQGENLKSSPKEVKEGPYKYNNILYLDMDGETVTGTIWNQLYGAINCSSPNYSISQQQEILDSVEFYFKGFALSVTTQKDIYNKYPAGRRLQLIITPTSSWNKQSQPSQAFFNTYRDGFDRPGFVFTDRIQDFRYIAINAAHAAGYSMGLQYYVGSQHYIMGTAYSGYVEWTTALNAFNQLQDDRALLNTALQ